MIELVTGNLLAAEAEALVNTVNTVGIMGKGIALQFKKAFPENTDAYERACRLGEVEPGRMFVVPLNVFQSPKFIINFPTKRHWKGKSKLEDIEAGLAALVEEVRRREIKSIAVPPLGCGNGGLDWNDVRPRIEKAFALLPDVRVLLYGPDTDVASHQMIDRTKRPNMTPGRAAVLCLMNRYQVPGYLYRLSMLEIQKLAYFMQAAGENLRLNFEKGPYGPYADNLRNVLQVIDGHFIEGYGDGVGTNRPETQITLFPEAAKEAEEFLMHNKSVQDHFARVASLIEGFETSYGMELLASVHWVASHEDENAKHDPAAATQDVHAWNERKRRLMHPKHIAIAWEKLSQQGWL